MPNHCFNRVEFYSDVEEDIKKLHDIFSINTRAEDEERTIFGQFIPEPHWPTTPLTEESAKGLVYDRGKVGELPVPGTDKRGPHFKSTGKADDRWYDWRLRYWDTKWDCYDLGMSDHDLPHGFEVQFNTAWAPPEGICRAMRKQFPDTDIQWFYDEPGEEIAGYL
jgi:hypothetical protein